MQTELIEGVQRRSDGRRIGIFYAENRNGQIFFGWSRVNTAAGDEFNLDEAVRAAKDNVGKPICPSMLRGRRHPQQFRERCTRFFPQAIIGIWPMTPEYEASLKEHVTWRREVENVRDDKIDAILADPVSVMRPKTRRVVYVEVEKAEPEENETA